MKNIFFDFGEQHIRADRRKAIQKTRSSWRNTVKFSIEDQCDERGSIDPLETNPVYEPVLAVNAELPGQNGSRDEPSAN
jgi:hypothetical protein